MKYILSLLLIFFLYSCSNTASHTVSDISSKVKKCCTTLSLDKAGSCTSPETEKEPAPVFSLSAFERSGIILTW